MLLPSNCSPQSWQLYLRKPSVGGIPFTLSWIFLLALGMCDCLTLKTCSTLGALDMSLIAGWCVPSRGAAACTSGAAAGSAAATLFTACTDCTHLQRAPFPQRAHVYSLSSCTAAGLVARSKVRVSGRGAACAIDLQSGPNLLTPSPHAY